MYGYVYQIIINDGTSKLNNHYYIGKHVSSTIDESYWGSGKILKDYIKIKGVSCLQRKIIAYAETNEELELLEKFYITEKDLNDPLCMNIVPGGTGGNKVGYLPIEDQKRIFENARKNGLKRYSDEKERKKTGEASLKLFKNQKFKDKHKAAVNEYFQKHREAGKLISKRNYKMWEDKERLNKCRERMTARMNSAEEKANVSERMTGARYYNNGFINKRFKQNPGDGWVKGKITRIEHKYKCWNNGVYQTYHYECPGDGWTPGRLYYTVPKDWEWYTNDVFNIRAGECPEGFRKGKTNQYKKYKKQCRLEQLNKELKEMGL